MMGHTRLQSPYLRKIFTKKVPLTFMDDAMW